MRFCYHHIFKQIACILLRDIFWITSLLRSKSESTLQTFYTADDAPPASQTAFPCEPPDLGDIFTNLSCIGALTFWTLCKTALYWCALHCIFQICVMWIFKCKVHNERHKTLPNFVSWQSYKVGYCNLSWGSAVCSLPKLSLAESLFLDTLRIPGISSVSWHFPFSRDFVVSAVSRHFWKRLEG